MMYGLLYRDAIREAHVMPVTDPMNHIPSDECSCNPSCEPVVVRDDVMMLYVHE